jgi:hypothetical protein
LTYEALGLCPEGKGGQLIDSGDVTYGGRWVVVQFQFHEFFIAFIIILKRSEIEFLMFVSRILLVDLFLKVILLEQLVEFIH